VHRDGTIGLAEDEPDRGCEAGAQAALIHHRAPGDEQAHAASLACVFVGRGRL
jgi:hypothetical protein